MEDALNSVVQASLEQAEQGGLKTPSDVHLPQIDVNVLTALQSQFKVEAIYPATSLQQGFIFHHISQPNDDAYRLQIMLDYHQGLDIERYQQAWRLASWQFPALRMAFNWESTPLQVITAEPAVTPDHFRYVDLRGASPEEQNQRITEQQQQDRFIGFQLDNAGDVPGLVHFSMLQQSDDLFTVIINMHHAIIDGWSNPILFGAVHHIYKQLDHKTPEQIRRDIVPETAYLATQDYYREHASETEAYWAQRRGRFPNANDLSAMLSEKQDLSDIKQIANPREAELHLGGAVYSELKSFCQQHGLTLNGVAQFAWHKLMQTYSADTETVVGTTVSGRDVPVDGVENSVGLFINTLPLLVDWSDTEPHYAPSSRILPT